MFRADGDRSGRSGPDTSGALDDRIFRPHPLRNINLGNTSWRLGRVSYNPLLHIDPFGPVVLPAVPTRVVWQPGVVRGPSMCRSFLHGNRVRSHELRTDSGLLTESSSDGNAWLRVAPSRLVPPLIGISGGNMPAEHAA